MNYKITLLFLCNIILLHAMDKPDIQVVPPLLKTLKVPGAIDSQMVYTPNGHLLIANVKTQSKNIMQIIKTAEYKDATDVDMPSLLDYITDVSHDSQYVITADALNELHQWNLNIEDQVALPDTKEATNAQYDNSGKRLLFSDPYGTYILDLTSNKIITSLGTTYQSADFSWHPTDDNRVGISTVGQDWQNSQWGIWDLVADKVRPLTTVPVQTTGDITFSKDGDYLVAAAVGQCVECDTKTAALTYYALNGGKSNNPLKGNNKSLYASQFLKGKEIRFYAGSNENTVVYCDTNDITKSFIFNPEPGNVSDPIYALAMNADGSHLAVPTQNANENIVKIFDVSAQKKFVQEREAVKKAQKVIPQFNVEGDEINEQASLEQTLGISASQSGIPKRGSMCHVV